MLTTPTLENLRSSMVQRKQLFLLTLLSNLNIDVKLRAFTTTKEEDLKKKIMGLLLPNANHVLGLFCTQYVVLHVLELFQQC